MIKQYLNWVKVPGHTFDWHKLESYWIVASELLAFKISLSRLLWAFSLESINHFQIKSQNRCRCRIKNHVQNLKIHKSYFWSMLTNVPTHPPRLSAHKHKHTHNTLPIRAWSREQHFLYRRAILIACWYFHRILVEFSLQLFIFIISVFSLLASSP